MARKMWDTVIARRSPGVISACNDKDKRKTIQLGVEDLKIRMPSLDARPRCKTDDDLTNDTRYHHTLQPSQNTESEGSFFAADGDLPDEGLEDSFHDSENEPSFLIRECLVHEDSLRITNRSKRKSEYMEREKENRLRKRRESLYQEECLPQESKRRISPLCAANENSTEIPINNRKKESPNINNEVKKEGEKYILTGNPNTKEKRIPPQKPPRIKSQKNKKENVCNSPNRCSGEYNASLDSLESPSVKIQDESGNVKISDNNSPLGGTQKMRKHIARNYVLHRSFSESQSESPEKPKLYIPLQSQGEKKDKNRDSHITLRKTKNKPNSKYGEKSKSMDIDKSMSLKLRAVERFRKYATKEKRHISDDEDPLSPTQSGGEEDPSSPSGTSTPSRFVNIFNRRSPKTPKDTAKDKEKRSLPNERYDPDRDLHFRTENILKLWILELKNVPQKKKYYCNLLVDEEIYHTTQSKQKTDICFWGDYCETSIDSQSSHVCVAVYKKATHLGYVKIDLVSSSKTTEKWFKLESDKNDKEIPQIRIKYRFHSVDILPLSAYKAFREYLQNNSVSLCQMLESTLPVKSKEDIASALVHIAQAQQYAQTFLVNLILNEVKNKGDNDPTLFRGNSLATKAIEAYMHLVGEDYLHDTVEEEIKSIIEDPHDMEVDPMKIPNFSNLKEKIQKHQNSLEDRVTSIWRRILQSSIHLPIELVNVFGSLKEALLKEAKSNLVDVLISSCIFLRFLCPAILNPSLFNILQDYPDETARRRLTLVAKTMQTLANFTTFKSKENYMEFLDKFIKQEQENCRKFLNDISNIHKDEKSTIFDGDIDLGKHLAILHDFLLKALTTAQDLDPKVGIILTLLKSISIKLADPSSLEVELKIKYNDNTTTSELSSATENSESQQQLTTGIINHNKDEDKYEETGINGAFTEMVSNKDLSLLNLENKNKIIINETNTKSSRSETKEKGETMQPKKDLKYDSKNDSDNKMLDQTQKGVKRSSIHEEKKAPTKNEDNLTQTSISCPKRHSSALLNHQYTAFYSKMDTWSHQMHSLCMDTQCNTVEMLATQTGPHTLSHNNSSSMADLTSEDGTVTPTVSDKLLLDQQEKQLQKIMNSLECLENEEFYQNSSV